MSRIRSFKNPIADQRYLQRKQAEEERRNMRLQASIQQQQAAQQQKLQNQSAMFNANMQNLARGQEFDAQVEADQNRVNADRRFQTNLQRRLSASGYLAPGDVPYAYGINPGASEQRRAAEAQRERDQLLYNQQSQSMDQQAGIQSRRDQQLADIQSQQNQQQFGFQRQLTDQSADIQSERDFYQDQYRQQGQRLASELGISEAEAQAVLREQAAQKDFERQSDLSEQGFDQSSRLSDQNFGQNLGLNDQTNQFRADRQDQEFDQQRQLYQYQAEITRDANTIERDRKKEAEGWTYSPRMQARKDKVDADYEAIQKLRAAGRYSAEQVQENLDRLSELNAQIYRDVRPQADTESMTEWEKANVSKPKDQNIGGFFMRGAKGMEYIPPPRDYGSQGSGGGGGDSQREYEAKRWDAASKARAEDMKNYLTYRTDGLGGVNEDVKHPGTLEEYYQRAMRTLNPPPMGAVPDEPTAENQTPFQKKVGEILERRRGAQAPPQQHSSAGPYDPWAEYLVSPEPASEPFMRQDYSNSLAFKNPTRKRTLKEQSEAKAAYALASKPRPAGEEERRKWQVAYAYPEIQQSKKMIASLGESPKVRAAMLINPTLTRELVAKLKQLEKETLRLLQASGERNEHSTRKKQKVKSALEEILSDHKSKLESEAKLNKHIESLDQSPLYIPDI